jgi:hypothetical protein
METSGMQQWYMERIPETSDTRPRQMSAIASSDGTHVRWNRREDLQIGKRDANSGIIYGVTKNEEVDPVEK